MEFLDFIGPRQSASLEVCTCIGVHFQREVFSTSELEINMNESNIKYFSHKLKRKLKNKILDGENYFVVILSQKMVKSKMHLRVKTSSRCPRMRYLVVYLVISKIDH